MEIVELIEALSRGEDGQNQFKANVTNIDAVAAELTAFSNSRGGRLYIGVDDDGTVVGLAPEDVRRVNQLISNSASQNVRPPVNPETQNIALPGGVVMVVTVPEGLSKPYMDSNGAIWVKSGSDKRKATSREEIRRMFQAAGDLHADEMPVRGTSEDDMDQPFFRTFYEKNYQSLPEATELSMKQLLTNMKLMEGNQLNLTGCLLFSKRAEFQLPAFRVKAVAFPGIEVEETAYLDSRDIAGRLSDVFFQTVSFLMSNTRRVQGEQGFNSEGLPEIPRIVWEELVANALVHRDYFIAAPVRVLVFADRVEIVSPGRLPNHLTVENIIAGNSNMRNAVLASFATKLLPYRGLGSGIRRVLKECPGTRFADDRKGNLFTAVVPREKP